jgi:hypothetical protein
MYASKVNDAVALLLVLAITAITAITAISAIPCQHRMQRHAETYQPGCTMRILL